jgi:hypothetical protein
VWVATHDLDHNLFLKAAPLQRPTANPNFPIRYFNASSTGGQLLLEFERLLKYLAGLERLLKIYLRHFLCS